MADLPRFSRGWESRKNSFNRPVARFLTSEKDLFRRTNL